METGTFPYRQRFVDESSLICLQSAACNNNANWSLSMSKKGLEPAALTRPSPARLPIVSSAHLVSPQSSEMSEFEFGLIVAGNSFHRWIAHCMSAAGLKDLTPLDVLVLHHVTHRARDKRLADICFIMNVEDTHLINYSLKKLQTVGVVGSSKNGKEVTYASTEAGRAYVQRYREIRESCLIDALQADDGLNRDIGELARLLRVLSGMYDQAARAAASL
jgi:predicted MarR family transcription regulator